ncbi:MAG TPA: amidohydrolase family protein [Acidimicrobiales bacterium]|jgi:imidazolonepropionase-like amidohydrolase
MKLLQATTVLTGRPNEFIENGEVLIDGATIKAVGPRGSCPVDGGVEVVDLTGCTVMPGMIDSHVHLGFDRSVVPTTHLSKESNPHLILRMAENARKLLSAGVTTARDLGGRDFLEVELRDAIEAGLAVGPHLVVATRPITNSGGHCWYMGGEADTPDAIRQVARENLRGGADCLKIMATGGGMTPVGPPTWKAQFSVDEIKVVVEEARMRDKHIAAHAHGTAGIRNAAEAGVTTIEHCSFATQSTTMITAEPDMDAIGRIIANDVYVCPTVSGILFQMNDRFGPGGIDRLLGRLAAMREAGVQMIAGTDSGFGMAGRENRMDNYAGGLEVFAAAGWDNASVIEAATILAARAIGIDDVTGSLDAGKRADVIAVRGNPLRELGAVRDLELVMVSGRCVTQGKVDTTASSGGLV